MLVKKYNAFNHYVRNNIPALGNREIKEKDFDHFIHTIITNDSLDMPHNIYCRDGFAYVKELDKSAYQVACFQINTFGEGAFGDHIVKLCTPMLLTLKTHRTHFYSSHTLKDTRLSFESFYLGTNYCGSKGELCNRDKMMTYAKELFQSPQQTFGYQHDIIYKLINANYICHHIAETLSYALGALDIFWYTKKNNVYLVSGSSYDEPNQKLKIDILDNFSYERMRSSFDIPHYTHLKKNATDFREQYDLMLWEVNYKREKESFYLPSGYQKFDKSRFNKTVNVVTTQHIVDYLLTSYFKRMNTHVVSNTFQTLEYLSRAITARMNGEDKVGIDFLKHASSCMGHYPDRNMHEVLEKREGKFPAFMGDYTHSMFFRPPVM